jgi:hypothetical protein
MQPQVCDQAQGALPAGANNRRARRNGELESLLRGLLRCASMPFCAICTSLSVPAEQRQFVISEICAIGRNPGQNIQMK